MNGQVGVEVMYWITSKRENHQSIGDLKGDETKKGAENFLNK